MLTKMKSKTFDLCVRMLFSLILIYWVHLEVKSIALSVFLVLVLIAIEGMGYCIRKNQEAIKMLLDLLENTVETIKIDRERHDG